MEKQKKTTNYSFNANLISFTLFICIFMISAKMSIAQVNIDPPPIIWGEIDKNDFRLTAPDFSPDATSLNICRYGQAYVSETADGLETRIDVHVRFIVLHIEGINRADVEINFWTGSKSDKVKGNAVKKTFSGAYRGSAHGNRVEDIEANVYNLNDNGKIATSKLKSDQIFVNDYSDIADYGSVTFALPNVGVGSIVEYKYTIVERNIFTVEKWYFQLSDPCLHSEYRVSFPDNMAYAIIKKGLMKDKIKFNPSSLTSLNTGRVYDEVYSYELDSVPGLPDEPAVMSMNNFRTQVMIQISEYYDYSTNSNVKVISSWKLLANEYKYSDRFGRILNRNSNLYSGLEHVLFGSATEMEKIEKMYNFVRDHFKCNNWGYTTTKKTLKEIYNETVGSAVEINLFLAGFLKKAGFKPKMALVSTREHGVVNEKYPFVAQFNHAICLLEIDGKTLFLDASSKEGDYRFPPAEIVGCKAFIVDPNNPEFIDITTNEIYNKFVMCTGSIANDSLEGKLQFKYRGYAAARERARLDHHGDEYMHDAINKNDLLLLSNPMIVNAEKVNKPLLTQVEYSMELSGMKTDELLYINPFKVYGDFKNDFKTKTREFPVEFNYLYKITYMYTIAIPEGYVIEDIPENTNTALSDNSASVLILYQQMNNVLQIKTELKINKLIILPNEYKNLKALFELWELRHNDMIVFRNVS